MKKYEIIICLLHPYHILVRILISIPGTSCFVVLVVAVVVLLLLFLCAFICLALIIFGACCCLQYSSNWYQVYITLRAVSSSQKFRVSFQESWDIAAPAPRKPWFAALLDCVPVILLLLLLLCAFFYLALVIFCTCCCRLH